MQGKESRLEHLELDFIIWTEYEAMTLNVLELPRLGLPIRGLRTLPAWR